MFGSGFVRVLSAMGTDLTVVNAARVSMGKSKTTFDEADAKLIRYLANHQHWTPFAHPQVTFHIKMPIFVARQFMRTNVGIVYNEISRRYVDDAPEYYVPGTFRLRPAKSIKQGSGGAIDPKENEACQAALKESCIHATNTYNTLLERGVAPEQARIVLPVCMFTEVYATGSLACFARICRLRQDSHAQSEIRDVATAIATIMSKLFPVSWAALTSTGGNDEHGKEATVSTKDQP